MCILRSLPVQLHAKLAATMCNLAWVMIVPFLSLRAGGHSNFKDTTVELGSCRQNDGHGGTHAADC